MHEIDNTVSKLAGAFGERVKNQFRISRRLVGQIDPGEILQLTSPRLLIQPLGVAPFTRLQRGIDEDFNEFAGGDELACNFPFGPERRDEGDQRDQSGFNEQFSHFGDAADILDAVGFGEAKIAVEPVPDIVAVEHEGMLANAWSLFSN